MQNQNSQEKKPTVNFKLYMPTLEKRAFLHSILIYLHLILLYLGT